LKQWSASALIPFADNHCGDYYCWKISGDLEPAVFFADHETGDFKLVAQSFVEWLEKQRF
jgi:hypothetical protein